MEIDEKGRIARVFCPEDSMGRSLRVKTKNPFGKYSLTGKGYIVKNQPRLGKGGIER